jgi:heptaprenyl diphosphate synthase
MRWRVDSKTRRVAIVGMLGGAAAALSLVERLAPLPLPVPGFKLGLSNIAVIAAFEVAGPLGGAAVALIKILISLLLSGNWIAFTLSLSGTLLSFISIFTLSRFPRDTFSCAGVGAASAASHAAGQIFAAAALTSSGAVFAWLPPLMLLSTGAGILTGMMLNLVRRRVSLKGESE